jgi:hypothetical protein
VGPETMPTDLAPAQGEAAAVVEISPLVSRPAPAELWVHTTGRTVADATENALYELGVTEAEAEIEVVAEESPWGHAWVEIRARIRGAEDCA